MTVAPCQKRLTAQGVRRKAFSSSPATLALCLKPTAVCLPCLFARDPGPCVRYSIWPRASSPRKDFFLWILSVRPRTWLCTRKSIISFRSYPGFKIQRRSTPKTPLKTRKLASRKESKGPSPSSLIISSENVRRSPIPSQDDLEVILLYIAGLGVREHHLVFQFHGCSHKGAKGDLQPRKRVGNHGRPGALPFQRKW